MKKIIFVLLVVQSLVHADFEKDKWYECFDINSQDKSKTIGIGSTMFGGLKLVNRNAIVEDIYYAREIAKGSKIYKFKTTLGEYLVEVTKDGAKFTNLYGKNHNYVDFETYLSCKIQKR